MTTPNGALLAARDFLAAGLSVIPILADGSKRPALAAWLEFQHRRMTAEELEQAFQNGGGVAIVLGRVSRNYVAFDFDAPGFFESWGELVEAEFPGLLASFPTVKTPKGFGRHIYMQTAAPPSREVSARVLGEDGKPGVAIEIRGEGCYVLSPGCPIECHELRRAYEHVAGPFVEEAPEVDGATFSRLVAIARSLNQCVEAEDIHEGPPREPGEDGEAEYDGPLRPGDDFNLRGDLGAVLTRAGWTLEKSMGAVGYWRRPGKEVGTSATLGACRDKKGNPAFYVFSSNAAPFQGGKLYSQFAAFATLSFGGDYALAALKLAEAGYGTKEAPTASLEHRTDLGNARRLVRYHGDAMRFCHPWKKWLVWDGRVWGADKTGAAQRLARDSIGKMLAEASRLEPEKRKKLARHALQCEAANRLANMLLLAAAEPGVPVLPEDLDRDPWLLNVANGTVNLRTGLLRPHRRRDLLTKIIETPYAPGARCPRWEQFIREIMDNKPALVSFLRRAAGSCLSGAVSDRVLFIPYGVGRNGKSVFLGTLATLLGEYALKVAMRTFLFSEHGGGDVYELADLRGVRFAYASEAFKGGRLSEALVKEITGKEMISARQIYQESIRFQPQFKPWISTNHKPEVRGTDPAIWDRLRLVPFTVRFGEPESPREDKGLSLTLAGELPGILAWAIEGCLEWQREGLGEPTEVVEATKDYRAEMDVIGDFLAERCLVDNDVTSTLTATISEVYNAYADWAKAAGEDVLSKKALGQRLQERGFKQGRDRQKRWWKGIRLLAAGEASS